MSGSLTVREVPRMSRSTDDGRHEGWILHYFADGSSGGGGRSHDETSVDYAPDGSPASTQDEFRHPGAVVAWQAICTNALDGGAICWRGPRWERVHTPEEADPDNNRGYTKDGLAEDGDLVAENMYIDWEEHPLPVDILQKITETTTAIAELEQQRSDHVAHARLLSQSWEAIGRAAGMTRQSAHERWSKTTG
jgi:hypothetical protein